MTKPEGGAQSATTQLNAARVAGIERMTAPDAERAARFNDSSARSAMDRPLAFMHIPKTSGSSLIAGLREVLPSTTCIGGFDLSMFGAFDVLEKVDPKVRESIYPDVLPPIGGRDFVAGHFAYSTLAKSCPDARVMTVLREPRSRILSLWMYWRAVADDALSAWGTWRDTVRVARQPLLDFLNHPEAACQTDNVAVRMLLWPHPLIPDAGFIDSASDQCMAGKAAARLKSFAFADVIENPQFEENVRIWLARPFVYPRVNETHMPPELRVRLRDELTQEALRLLEHRSRLDRPLWLALASERIATAEPGTLSDDIFRRTVARYEGLMAA